ncbi:hypothetical protein JHK87_054285 [Glycine soja]|nr:hypothetical protein JHK87_054285 [Glycine soja]
MGGGIVELELGAGVVAWTKSNVVGECIFELLCRDKKFGISDLSVDDVSGINGDCVTCLPAATSYVSALGDPGMQTNGLIEGGL